MNTLNRSITVLAVAGLVAFGIAAAQQQGTDKLDLDELAQRLELTSEVKAQVAPEIERLNQLHTSFTDEWRRHQELRAQLREARSRVEEVLTSEQRAGFRELLRDTYRLGPTGAAGPAHLGAGHMGAGHMGTGRMGTGSHMWNGPGSTMMGPGTCDGTGPHGPAHHRQSMMSMPQSPRGSR